jgi:hypothetical protein
MSSLAALHPHPQDLVPREPILAGRCRRRAARARGGAAAVAVVLYAAGSGVWSIARGIVPLALFGPARYPVVIGQLAACRTWSCRPPRLSLPASRCPSSSPRRADGAGDGRRRQRSAGRRAHDPGSWGVRAKDAQRELRKESEIGYLRNYRAPRIAIIALDLLRSWHRPACSAYSEMPFSMRLNLP